MRGVLVGSVLLIALYVGVQGAGPQAAAGGLRWLVGGVRRLLSPEVAGIPQVGNGGGE